MGLNIGGQKYGASMGTNEKIAIYVGTQKVYPTGGTITYHLDSGAVYNEERESGENILVPKSFTTYKAGWEFVGWRDSSDATSDVLTGTYPMGEWNWHLYAVFRQSVTLTSYNGSTTASTNTGYRYYNNGNVKNPSVTLSQNSINGWTARGWSTSNAAAGAITYSNGATVTFSSNITVYGCYYKAVNLYYYGNGATGGSTAAQTLYAYYNSSGNASYPTFTVAQNGFTYSGYNFNGWTLGPNGDAYAVGSTITLSTDATMYARWVSSGIYIIRDGDFTNLGQEPNGDLIKYNVSCYIGSSRITAMTDVSNANGTHITDYYTGQKLYGILGMAYKPDPAGAWGSPNLVNIKLHFIVPDNAKRLHLDIFVNDYGGAGYASIGVTGVYGEGDSAKKLESYNPTITYYDSSSSNSDVKNAKKYSLSIPFITIGTTYNMYVYGQSAPTGGGELSIGIINAYFEI